MLTKKELYAKRFAGDLPPLYYYRKLMMDL